VFRQYAVHPAVQFRDQFFVARIPVGSVHAFCVEHEEQELIRLVLRVCQPMVVVRQQFCDVAQRDLAQRFADPLFLLLLIFLQYLAIPVQDDQNLCLVGLSD
jgi:hypothetical protein